MTSVPVPGRPVAGQAAAGRSRGSAWRFNRTSRKVVLNVLGLLDSPSTGSYWFFGEDVARHSERQLTRLRRERIGFVFQSFNLIDDLSVAENVEVALLYRRVAAPERRKRVREALERVGIAHRAGHRPQQLSGGQQQRVAVARALVSGPSLILADEPTGNLDAASAHECLTLLSRLNTAYNKTIVMVTHDPHAAQFASVVHHLEKGELAATA